MAAPDLRGTWGEPSWRQQQPGVAKHFPAPSRELLPNAALRCSSRTTTRSSPPTPPVTRGEPHPRAVDRYANRVLVAHDPYDLTTMRPYHLPLRQTVSWGAIGIERNRLAYRSSSRLPPASPCTGGSSIGVSPDAPLPADASTRTAKKNESPARATRSVAPQLATKGGRRRPRSPSPASGTRPMPGWRRRHRWRAGRSRSRRNMRSLMEEAGDCLRLCPGRAARAHRSQPRRHAARRRAQQHRRDASVRSLPPSSFRRDRTPPGVRWRMARQAAGGLRDPGNSAGCMVRRRVRRSYSRRWSACCALTRRRRCWRATATPSADSWANRARACGARSRGQKMADVTARCAASQRARSAASRRSEKYRLLLVWQGRRDIDLTTAGAFRYYADPGVARRGRCGTALDRRAAATRIDPAAAMTPTAVGFGATLALRRLVAAF